MFSDPIAQQEEVWRRGHLHHAAADEPRRGDDHAHSTVQRPSLKVAPCLLMLTGAVSEYVHIAARLLD